MDNFSCASNIAKCGDLCWKLMDRKKHLQRCNKIFTLHLISGRVIAAKLDAFSTKQNGLARKRNVYFLQVDICDAALIKSIYLYILRFNVF